jgi:quercetin dioxygenase-like cupin family protein
MYRRKTENIPDETVAKATETYRRILVSADEAPNFALRRFEIKPGGEIPMHKNTVEHEQYVLSGRADVIIGAEHFVAEPGDALFIPADVEHCYRTVGEESYVFLCIVPNQEDVLTLAE